jgi:hypothetical protein
MVSPTIHDLYNTIHSEQIVQVFSRIVPALTAVTDKYVKLGFHIIDSIFISRYYFSATKLHKISNIYKFL